MIPLTLVTGFLGAGKTTLLRRLAQRTAGPRLVFVVNEFAEVDIDGRLLGDGTDMVPIPGGSIFCTCLTATFIEQLEALIVRHEADGFDGVVIEASGVADPRVLQKMLIETGLERYFFVSQVIAVAEPRTLPKLLDTLPNTRSQLASADVVLLNKTDTATPDEIEACEQAIHDINAGVPIERTVRCDVDVAVIVPGIDRQPGGEYAKCADPNFCRLLVVVDDQPTREALAKRVMDAARWLYRLKGWARCEEGWTHVQFSSGRVELSEAAEVPEGVDVLAVIGQGGAAGELNRVLNKATPGLELTVL